MLIAATLSPSSRTRRVGSGTRPGFPRFSPVSVYFGAVKGEDGTMSSDSSVSPDQPKPPQKAAPAHDADKKPRESAVKFTRTASVWTSLTAGFLILIVLLIFITQNTTSADFTFLGLHWSLPLGVAILLAAVSGGLITVLVGTARMYQLRRAAKRNLVSGH
jgi:uncharacterized integral membrane protein